MVVDSVLLGALFGVDSLLYKNGVLERRANARGLDDGFVDSDGFFNDCGSAVALAVDNGLVYANAFLERRGNWSAGSCVNGGLFHTDGFLEGRATVMVRVAAVYNGLGDLDVLAVAWLITSTVFTLDLVDGAEVLVVLVVRRVVVVVPVCVDFNVRINVR